MLLLGLLWQLGRRRANRLSKIPAGMGCVCVCVYGGCFRASCEALAGGCALCQAEGGWGGCHGIAGIWFALSCFFLFFLAEQEVQGWPGGCSAAQHPWIAACIPEPRAKCSTLGGMGACAPWALPPPGCRRMLQPPGFGSGAGCREGRRCLKTGMSAFLWLRSVFAPGVAQPGIFAVSSVGARGYL